MHILKSIRNNWVNQKDIRKTFHFPNFQNIKLDYCVYPVQVYSASFSDVRLPYELTLAALKLQNELSNEEYRNNTHDFVEILLQLWKLFNINSTHKGKRFNDDMSRPYITQILIFRNKDILQFIHENTFIYTPCFLCNTFRMSPL